jgi:glyoxylase-like metal-dependent hydrolase (beta-lactamase superfamily II)
MRSLRFPGNLPLTRARVPLSIAPFVLAALVLAPQAFADGPKLYVLDCGVIGLADVSGFGLTNDETPVRELFVPCYVIDHAGQQMLWDAGLPDAIVGQGEVTEDSGMTMRMDDTMADKLAVIGLAPADIDIVAFSHMHFDHVGAANLFTGAHLLIQDTEYEAAFVAKDNPVFQPDLYLGLSENERTLLSGDHDVFGDGAVTIVSAPGHTPGHQVLLLRLANTGPLVLSGDLYHFAESRALRRTPVFNTDAEATLHSMDKVEALIREEGATLWIEHEKALAETLELAPAFYD